MATAGSGGHHEFDLRVPVLQGDTTKDFKKYEKVVETHVLSITGRDEAEVDAKKGALGPALYKNLLLASNSVSTLIEQHDPDEFTGDLGWERLLTLLRDERFHEGKLAELPRVYERFYKNTTFKKGPREPMQAYIAEKSLARQELQKSDPQCSVSDNEMAFWLLEH